MRFHLLSDIHDDYSSASGASYDIPAGLAADAILCVGDIAGRLSRRGLRWLMRQRDRTGLPIVLCAGNHDYWRSSLDTEIGRFRDRLGSEQGIHLLDGDEIVLNGCRILGGTLWTDYEIYSDAYTAHVESTKYMNDLRMIRTNSYQRRLRTWMLAEEHQRYRAFIEARLTIPFAGATIVMTHHAPSGRSLLGGRCTEPLDASYASNLEPLVRRYNPDFWLHGHIHERRDYQLAGTRILANPRGYVRAAAGRFRPAEIENPAFDPALVIDTDDHRPLATGANLDIAIDRPNDFQWPFGREPG
ncbi:phosphatase [Aureimonas endophytica]|uniref:Phosphatase n=1 Tax=Aureimonas endophytica TaxID=2027858 RepID=A0A917E3N8_9HYPH|nr:metallophosphoesterase [Aureimonas endophytica]GGE00599.1 phosphatase [Aureimonas endophytica]